MRTLALAVLALLIAPSVTLAGPCLKALHEHHAQHLHAHKMKKAMKQACNNCDGDGAAPAHHHHHHH
jgi:hypothetical protein